MKLSGLRPDFATNSINNRSKIMSVPLRYYRLATTYEERGEWSDRQRSTKPTPPYGQRHRRRPQRTTSNREARSVSARVRFQPVPDHPCVPQNGRLPYQPWHVFQLRTLGVKRGPTRIMPCTGCATPDSAANFSSDSATGQQLRHLTQRQHLHLQTSWGYDSPLVKSIPVPNKAGRRTRWGALTVAWDRRYTPARPHKHPHPTHATVGFTMFSRTFSHEKPYILTKRKNVKEWKRKPMNNAMT